MNTTSIPRQVVIDDELTALAIEIAQNTPGLSWNDAIDTAIEQFSDLFDLAIQWDTDAAIEAIEYFATGVAITA